MLSATGSVRPLSRWRRGVQVGASLLLSGLICGFGYTIIPWYYYHFDAKNQVAAVIRNAGIESDEELKRKLARVVARLGIRGNARDFIIQRSGDAINVQLHYTEAWTVTLLGRSVTLLSMNFDLLVDGKIR